MPVGLLLMSLTVAGCATTMGSGGTKVACTSFQPISWSKKDTDVTIRDVKQHNAAWKAVCL
jgi:hypothetical protein